MANEELIIRIGAKSDAFNAELKRLSGKTKNLEKQLKSVAKVSAIAFTGLVATAGLAIKKFNDFEKKFTNVITLLDDGSFKTGKFKDNVKKMQDELLSLGAASGETFDDLNQGLFDLISAGVPAGEAMDVLSSATELAAAGATTVDIAVKALTASLTAYGDEAGSATDISEKFFTAQKYGVTTVGELATEFNKVAGRAKDMGISFDEALAASTALTANGAKPTTQAFTEMKSLMVAITKAQSRMGDESKAVQKALSLENIERVGILQSLKEFNIAADGSSIVINRVLRNSNATSAAISLMGSQSALATKIFKEMNDETRRSAVFQDALKVKNATLEKSLNKLKTSANAFAIVIGAELAPDVKELAGNMTDLAKSFTNADPETKKMVATMLKLGIAITGGITALATAGAAFLSINATMGALGITVAKIIPQFRGLLAAMHLISGAKVLEGTADEFDAATASADRLRLQYKWVSEEREKFLKEVTDSIGTGEEEKVKQQYENWKINYYDKVIADVEKAASSQGISLTKDEATKKAAEPLTEKGLGDISRFMDTGNLPQTSDISSQEDSASTSVDSVKEAETKKAEAKKEVKAAAFNEELQAEQDRYEILKAQNEGQTEEEIEIKKARQALDLEERDIKTEEDIALRDQKFANLKLEHEKINKLEADMLAKKKKAKDDFIKSVNEQDNLSKKDKEKLITAYQKMDKEDKLKLAENQKAFNSQMDQLDQARSQMAFGFAKASGDAILKLMGANNTLGIIMSKGFAVADIMIKYGQAQMAATASSAALGPILGPPAFAAMSAKINGNLALSLGTVAAQTFSAFAANDGALVTGGQVGVDSQLYALSKGELVVPERNFDEVVTAYATQKGIGSGGGGDNSPIIEALSRIEQSIQSARTVNFNGDILSEEPFIDRIMQGIQDSIDFRNGELTV